MSYLVLARKWRPASFDEVIGQQGVIQTLKNAITMDRVAHAYLFCGARGVGKTSVARILAKALNCQQGPSPEPDHTCASCLEITSGHSQDVFEIDGASNTGVDDVRSLRENARYLPASSRYKIYIIDEVHMLSTSAFNALLKTLEEPPEHVKFIFATTEPHKIPLTVLSRCQRFDFKRIPTEAILQQLSKILTAEEARIEEEGLRVIAREAAGSMRDALSLTDQVLAFSGDEITAAQVVTALGLAKSEMFAQVTLAIVEKRSDDLMHLVEQLFDGGHDLKRFLEGLLWHVRNLILYCSLKDPGDLVDVSAEDRQALRQQATMVDALRWHQVFDILARALEEIARNPHPRLVLETALLRLSAAEPLFEVGDLLGQVQDLARQLEAAPRHGKPGGPGPSSATSKRAEVPPSQPRPTFEIPKRPEKKGPPPPTQKPVEQPALTPPKSTPAESTPAEPTPAEPSSSGTGFPEGWAELVALVSKHRPSLGSVLNHACPLEISPERVRIGLESGSFYADQMRTERNHRELRKFCQEFTGTECKLQVEDQQDNAGATLAQTWEREKKESAEKKRSQVLAHPMVQEAIRVFGAEIEQVRDLDRSKQ